MRFVTYGRQYYNLPREEFKATSFKDNLRIVSLGAGYKELQDDLQGVADKASFWRTSRDVFLGAASRRRATVKILRRLLFSTRPAGFKRKEVCSLYHAHGYEFQAYDGTFSIICCNTWIRPCQFQMVFYWFEIRGRIGRLSVEIPETLPDLKRPKARNAINVTAPGPM